jgi:hypothetical protein
MRQYGYCCNTKRYSKFCPDCGKEINQIQEYNVETLYQWLFKKYIKESSSRTQDKWKGWIDSLYTLMTESGRYPHLKLPTEADKKAYWDSINKQGED